MPDTDRKITEFPEGRVETRIVDEHVVICAIWRGKVLNRLIYDLVGAPAEAMFTAGVVHRELFEAWSKATEGNLLDEAQDASPENDKTWTKEL